MDRRLRTVGAAIAFLAVTAVGLQGQSLTAGGIGGVVHDADGRRLGDAVVTLMGAAGPGRQLETDSEGRFQADYVLAGEYELLAEHLGYRPRRVVGVRVATGRFTFVEIRLVPATPPVSGTDTVLASGASLLAVAGAAQSGRRSLMGVPWGWRNLGDAAIRSSRSSKAGGLAPFDAVLEVDGLPYREARHVALGEGTSRLTAFPLAAIANVDVQPDDSDVERSTGPGGLISATTWHGGRTFTASWLAEASPGALTAPSGFPAPATDPNGFAGALAVAGPLAGDTAQFAFGGGFRRVSSAIAPLADPELAGSTAARDAINARLDAGPYWESGVRNTDVIDAFARIDWSLSENHSLFSRFAFARQSGDPDLDGRAGHALVASFEGTDIASGVGLTSRLGERSALELRVGFNLSTRDYSGPEEGPAVPWTSLVSEGIVLGAEPAGPGRFRRTGVTLRQTSHVVSGAHTLKFGAGADLATHEHDYVFNARGSWAFADATALLGGTGVFERTLGQAPGSFPIRSFYVFAQDHWTASQDLQFTLGLRVGRTTLPLDRVAENEEWLDLAGLSNAAVDAPVAEVSPRLGLRWDASGDGRVVIQATAGRYHGDIDPGIVAALIGDAGDARVQRIVGAIAGWPTDPSANVTAGRRTLTLLGPKFAAPASDRLTAGVTFGLPAGLAFGLAATASRTTGLPRRVDLNRLPGPTGRDMNRRPIYGELVQQRSLVVARPGTNRRFDTFDQVNAIQADGEARYAAISAAIEYAGLRGTELFARYTFSRTEDDWLGAAAGDPRVSIDPFPDGLDGTDWRDGRSDYDVPHRLVAGGMIALPGLPVRIGGLYRVSSGRPFTPGFRPGVDVNGDGVSGNDPAFVEASGLGPLATAWPCLSTQSGRFSERNACREPTDHELDLRISIGIGSITGGRAELVVDGLGLIESDRAVRDHGLYLIDPAKTVTTDPITGNVTLPLIVNPGFGQPLLPLTRGRTLRIAFQVRN